MTDVMLVYPPYSWGQASPPIGLAYIAAVLRDSGNDVRIVDMNPTHITLDQLEKILRDDQPKLVGISAMTCQANVALRVAELAKRINRSSKVVVGGPHPTALPEEMLGNTAIDFVCIGEGEDTMKELVRSLLDGSEDVESISGLAYRNGDGEIVRTNPRTLISDLNSIPFPAWDLLPVDKYSVSHSGRGKFPTFTLLSSRGCPYGCIFCSSSLSMGKRFRMRSAENIFAEIQMLYDRYGMRQFDFVDDTMTIDGERVAKLCGLLVESRMDMTWSCNSTVRIKDLTVLRKMRDAGCVRIDFGVESGDADILKTIGKGITIPQVIKAHKYAKEAGIETGSFFMVALPGQDRESIAKSLSLLREIDTDFPGLSIATPYPGTELYEISKKNNWLKISNWDKYLTIATGTDHKPVMETDKMNQAEIMDAYALFTMEAARLVLKKRYGARFWLNPRLYIDSLRSSGQYVNRRLLLRNLRVLPRLLKRELGSGRVGRFLRAGADVRHHAARASEAAEE